MSEKLINHFLRQKSQNQDQYQKKHPIGVIHHGTMRKEVCMRHSVFGSCGNKGFAIIDCERIAG